MPIWLAIITAVAGALFGGLGVLATFRRGDFARPHLRHILEIYQRGRSYEEKIARRAGVMTLCYVIPSRFDQYVILQIPHGIFNPGRLPIKNISVLAQYPDHVGLEDGLFRKIWATFGDGEPEYFKSRRGEITGYGTQVMMSGAAVRGGEAINFADFFLVPPLQRKQGPKSKMSFASAFEARMKANSLIRECFEMQITVFSEMTSARTRRCKVIVLNEIDRLKPQRTLEVLSEMLWAGGRPAPGLYIKYPWSQNPLAWEFADIIRPALDARAVVDGKVFHLQSPAKSEIARGVYSVPADNYRDMPSDLSHEQRENYLGISRAYIPGAARKSSLASVVPFCTRAQCSMRSAKRYATSSVRHERKNTWRSPSRLD